MNFRIKPFVLSGINWGKTGMRTFLLIYGGISLVSIAFLYNLIAARSGTESLSYSMNYFSTFMIMILINGIVMGASKHQYDVWLTLGMTRKEIIVGYIVKFAIMSGFVIIAYLGMTYGLALVQSILFKTDFNSIVNTESLFTLYSLNPLTFVFAAFFMTFSTCAMGFITGIVFSRWKKIAFALILLCGALFFLATTNLINDPMGTLNLIRIVFKPVEMFINYYLGDHNAVTIGINNLIISVSLMAVGYLFTIKRIARIN